MRSASVDASRNSIAYAVSLKGNDVIRDEGKAKVRQVSAEASGSTAIDSDVLRFDAVVLLLGVGKFFSQPQVA